MKMKNENENKNLNQYLSNNLFLNDKINKNKNSYEIFPNNNSKNNKPIDSAFLNDISTDRYTRVKKNNNINR